MAQEKIGELNGWRTRIFSFALATYVPLLGVLITAFWIALDEGMKMRDFRITTEANRFTSQDWNVGRMELIRMHSEMLSVNEKRLRIVENKVGVGILPKAEEKLKNIETKVDSNTSRLIRIETKLDAIR